MIGFRLTPELEELQVRARRFAQEEIAPIAAEYDEREEYPHFVTERAYEAGLANMNVPVEYGGPGLGLLANCVATEELGAACSGITTNLMVSNLATVPLVLFGTEEQKQRFLETLIEERGLAAFCLSEPQAGSDAGSIQTTALLDGDAYVVNGHKIYTTNGSFASYYTVFALTDPEKGARGMSTVLVPADLPGIEVVKVEKKMGQRASNTAQITFTDVRVPRENLLGQEGRGFPQALKVLDYGRAGVAALSTGVARQALELATEYAKERVQFGKAIAELQAIQFMLADMATEVEAARLLTWQAAWMADEGLPQAKQAAMAKCYAADVAMRVTTDAVQIFGGYGYMRDHPVEKLMRDAKILQIYEGTNQIQRIVIARNLLRGK
jgi:acyl-CoA dehydrogenase